MPDTREEQTERSLDAAVMGVQAALLEAFGGTDDIVWEHWTTVINHLTLTPEEPGAVEPHDA
jgi:hypothetical protein